MNPHRALKGRHVLSVDQFDRPAVSAIVEAADMCASRPRQEMSRVLAGRTVACVFYQPSTRTYASFLAAAQRLGAGTVPIQGVEYSSVAKGETLEDTIRTLSCYADAVVLRHPEVGSAERASKVSECPVINAGDGPGEHPTQALLDLYTIWKETGKLQGATVTMVGDLRFSRTVHSLAKLLAMFGASVHFVSPAQLSVPCYVKDRMSAAGCHFTERAYLDPDLVADSDAVYVTRVQREYMPAEEYAKVAGAYRFGPAEVARMRPDACLLHPLPRVDEIPPEVDSAPQAAYFRQVRHGLHVRMALLALTIGA